jgi:hypothetical protein
LDRRGLFNSTSSSLTEAEKRKKRNELFGDIENDDDTLYDKTARGSSLAKKKALKNKVENLSSLTEKRREILEEMKQLGIEIRDAESASESSSLFSLFCKNQ